MNDSRMGRMFPYRWMSMVLVLLVLVGCTVTLPSAGTPSATPSSSLPSAETDPLANTSWQLVALQDTEGETATLTDSTATLEFSGDGQAGGNTGCNSYGGSYQVQDDSLHFDELVSTLMACADEAVMQQEQNYLQALEAADRFEVAADRLTIWVDEGNSQLTFAPLTANTSAPPAAGSPSDTVGDEMAERVEFEPGESTATLSGTLAAGGEKNYALAAGAGQSVTVQTVGDETPVSFTVYGPGGASWTGETQAGADNGVMTQIAVPENGDYLVTLTAAAEGAETNYEVTFTVDPSAVERIAFPAGETTAERSGLLPSGPVTQQYLLSANSGMTLTVDAASDETPLSMTIESPSGNQRIPEMMPAPDGYTIGHQFTLPEPGYYLVTLAKGEDAPSTNFTVTFTLTATSS